MVLSAVSGPIGARVMPRVCANLFLANASADRRSNSSMHARRSARTFSSNGACPGTSGTGSRRNSPSPPWTPELPVGLALASNSLMASTTFADLSPARRYLLLPTCFTRVAMESSSFRFSVTPSSDYLRSGPPHSNLGSHARGPSAQPDCEVSPSLRDARLLPPLQGR
jgi:hypothetical protein